MNHDPLNSASRADGARTLRLTKPRTPETVPSVRFLDCSVHAQEPWINGGGTTRTLARGNNRSGSADWRVSLADLTGAAKFSQFPEFDRTLLLVDDGVVDLHSHEGQILARPGQAVNFSGDLNVWISLLAKPVRVLNVMTRRTAFRSNVSVATNSRRITPASVQILISLSGQWNISSSLLKNVPLAPMHGIWIESRTEELDLHHVGVGAELVSIAIEPIADVREH